MSLTRIIVRKTKKRRSDIYKLFLQGLPVIESKEGT